ncbi:hypothetical protein HYH02_003482 [Chlamydomonas schloesseri]|uniref:Uncharacterized protein n=1 Tax=Chlamydomonas schloesseri TaxID=2026947 RepID=A0A836B9E9_9CHLO|nr:hypothetical protein HYH02_003482 [Chlamydomonas schloesseri]|eukprot:KAG2451702.1 hypothetical protein HYH02_003482 [Chlamydomonas schloesseri]
MNSKEWNIQPVVFTDLGQHVAVLSSARPPASALAPSPLPPSPPLHAPSPFVAACAPSPSPPPPSLPLHAPPPSAAALPLPCGLLCCCCASPPSVPDGTTLIWKDDVM